MNFISQFKDGSNFSGTQGYWDDCPDNGITALHVTLPFSIKKRNPDGSVTELDPSTVMISGFEKYYFAHRAKSSVSVGRDAIVSQSPNAPEYLGCCMAGLDYTHDFVLYIEIDKRGNVVNKRFTIDRFMKTYQIAESALRKGA